MAQFTCKLRLSERSYDMYCIVECECGVLLLGWWSRYVASLIFARCFPQKRPHLFGEFAERIAMIRHPCSRNKHCNDQASSF